MKQEIKEIWIESEAKGVIIGGTPEIDDNSDVIITFVDGSRFVATLFTYANIQNLRKKNQNTGECLAGRYFWASDMLIVDRIHRKNIEEIIYHLIADGGFEYIFNRIESS